MSQRLARLAVLACLVVATVATVPAAHADMPSWCTSSGPIDVYDLPDRVPPMPGCDLVGRTVVGPAVRLSVPARGHGVGLNAVAGNFAGVEMSLIHEADGTLMVHIDPHERASDLDLLRPLRSRLKPDPCAATTTYTLEGGKRYTAYVWRYNVAGEPASVAGLALEALVRAAANVATGTNDCGMTDIPRAEEQFLGTSTTPPGVAWDTCGPSDGTSVIGWGALPEPRLAATCNYYSAARQPYEIIESDQVYDPTEKWTTTLVPCLDSWDLESVATHEFGHSFGLGHVPEDDVNSAQTMSPYVDAPCDPDQRTLGRGDVRGLIALYGSY